MKIYVLFCASLFLIISSSLAFTEKKFVIVIPSYNNQKWYIHNLESVLSQNYTNFRILYTDDCSYDETGRLVEEYLLHNDPNQRVQLIKNSERRGGLHNLYRMIHLCDDDEIIVTIDGDDWLPDNDVLTRLNNIYSSDDVWLTYGQFQHYPAGDTGWASPVPDHIITKNAFREYPYLPTHLRTFYAWLFKEIKLEDLLYCGKFYPMAYDMAMMFPMIEMAAEHHRFVSDIMYIYNQTNGISNHYVSRQLQLNLLENLKKRTPYNRLLKKPITKKNVTKSDVVIFAKTPIKLNQLLISLEKYVKGTDTIFTMYRPSSPLEEEQYNTMKSLYPDIIFFMINQDESNFRDALVEIYKQTSTNYILFINDNAQFAKKVSLHECINALDKTSAYAFYFKFNAQSNKNRYLPLLECTKNIYAWDFAVAQNEWSCANSLDLVLYKKINTFLSTLLKYDNLTLFNLQKIWENQLYTKRVGLCFNESHIQ